MSFESTIDAACKAKQVAGIVFLAGDEGGTWEYRNQFGQMSPKAEYGDPETQVNEDSIMWIASCTKLMTTVSIMQCVERGLVTLDEDVRPIVTELKELDILELDGKGEIVGSRKNERPITLRQLLTHTSGFVYDFMAKAIADWRTAKRLPPSTPLSKPQNFHTRFLQPLLFEPGTNWAYGPGLDWAGRVLETITGSTLETYMKTNIWEPLGMHDTTFFPSTHPDFKARRTVMAGRVPDQQEIGLNDEQHCFLPDAMDCLGGQGLFSSPANYFKFLRAVLRLLPSQNSSKSAKVDAKTDGFRLLKPETAQAMFDNRVGAESCAAIMALFSKQEAAVPMGKMPLDSPKDHGLGGVLIMQDTEGWRQKGTMIWGGAPNLHWWIDAATGICGLSSTQLLPAFDAKCSQHHKLFEVAMYERLAAHRADKTA